MAILPLSDLLQKQADREEEFRMAFIRRDSYEMQRLFDQGISIDFEPRTRHAYLPMAVSFHDPVMVDWLLDHGANPNGAFPNEVPLVQAVSKRGAIGSLDNGTNRKDAQALELIIDALLARGADLDPAGHPPPLSIALDRHLHALAIRLVQAGANVDRTDGEPSSRPPTLLAAEGMALQRPQSKEVFDLILSKKPNLEWRDPVDGKTCLLKLMQYVNEEPALRLIEAGADVDAVGQDGQTSCVTAIKRGKINLLKALCAKDAKLDGLYQYTSEKGVVLDLFGLAAHYCHVDIMEYLWQKGARFHPEATSPVVAAAAVAHVDSLRWALAHGAGLESRWGKKTALTILAGTSSAEAFKMLLYAGADQTPSGTQSVMEVIRQKESIGVDDKKHYAALIEHENELLNPFLQSRFEIGMLSKPEPSWLTRIGQAISPPAPLLIGHDGKATTLLLRFAGASKLQDFFEQKDWQHREPQVMALYKRFHDALPPHYQQRLRDTVDLSWARREQATDLSETGSVAKRWARPRAPQQEAER